MSGKKKKSSWLIIVLFNLGLIILLLGGAELAYRRILLSRIRFEDASYFEYDPELGWVPAPGEYQSRTGPVTITDQRFRKTPGKPGPIKPETILAVGDSYTFCNYVGDHQTWPSYLAGTLNCRVINAGVSGYGFDQSVLRLERVLGRVKPEMVILSLIYDDIPRSELSRRVHYKPYFRVIDGNLQLFNQPAPSPVKVGKGERWYDSILIFRDLWDSILGNINPHRHDIREHREGMDVARLLCLRTRELAREAGARLLIVIQPNREEPLKFQKEGAEKFESIVRSLDIPVLNLYPLLEKDFPEVEKRFDLWVYDSGHHSARGNKWVASRIAGYIIDNFNYDEGKQPIFGKRE